MFRLGDIARIPPSDISFFIFSYPFHRYVFNSAHSSWIYFSTKKEKGLIEKRPARKHNGITLSFTKIPVIFWQCQYSSVCMVCWYLIREIYNCIILIPVELVGGRKKNVGNIFQETAAKQTKVLCSQIHI